MSTLVIDLAVVFGAMAVLPLALGGRWWWWQVAAISAGVSLFALPRGAEAAVVALPWTIVAVVVLATTIRSMRPTERMTVAGGARMLACLYAIVAGGALVVSRAGLAWFGIPEPIVELTTVHYTYAGAASLVLAVEARRAVPGRGVGTLALGFTAVAPPVVALGFLIAHPIPQVGGAVVMSLGVCLTAALELVRATRHRDAWPSRALLAVSGLAVWVPMALAVSWALGQYWRVPLLSIPDMARTHGVANALGFVVCGLLARRGSSRSSAKLMLAA